MLRNLAAYLVAFFLAPTFGGLATLVSFPIIATVLPKPRGDNPRTPSRIWGYAFLSGFFCIAAAFAAIWFARVVFGWFRVEPTVTIAWVIGAGSTALGNTGRFLEFV
jgi:hypothetical protein